MEITDIRLSRLHNAEHLHFMHQFNDLVVGFTQGFPRIENRYSVFLQLFADEQEAFNVVQKSSFTDLLKQANTSRNFTFRGLSYVVKGYCCHYDLSLRKAALKLQVVFDRHGNIGRLSYPKKSASIGSLLKVLNESFSDELNLLDLSGWLTELEANNRSFSDLMNSRYSESVGKTSLQMTKVRQKMDPAYRNMIKHINALIDLNEGEAYDEFAQLLNVCIKRYARQMAIGEGRRVRKNENEVLATPGEEATLPLPDL